MRPFLGGGEMIDIVSETHVTYNEIPHKFEAGTPPIAEAYGLKVALEYLTKHSKKAIATHEDALLAYATEKLRDMKGLKILGTAQKASVISFTLDYAHAHDVATILDQQGIAIRAGTHCAMPLLKHYGVSSTCRVSFGMYNTFADIDALYEGLKKVEMLFL